MFKLNCKAQNYDWGRIGIESTVGQLVNDGGHAEDVDKQKPYAELWMGVHPNGLSVRGQDGKSLVEVLKENPNYLAQHERGTIQFLFKILSVQKALSVQSHPTKEQAQELHGRDPKNYPDPNHKPEMAIALTDFQLLCGFRPAKDVYANIKGIIITVYFPSTPELLFLLGSEEKEVENLLSKEENVQKEALRKIFTKIWSTSQEDISKAVAEMILRLKYYPEPSDVDKLLIRLDSEFPGGDVGVFAPLLLNYFTLKPGQSTFLGPNRPHAYLFGDCVECMACSDNTIRAGLTPKYKDISTLCTNLDYTMADPPLFSEQKKGEGMKVYAPPVPEFAVHEITNNCSSVYPVGASSLLIVVQGSASLQRGSERVETTRGNVVFISNDSQPVHITHPSNNFLAFQAFTPLPN